MRAVCGNSAGFSGIVTGISAVKACEAGPNVTAGPSFM